MGHEGGGIHARPQQNGVMATQIGKLIPHQWTGFQGRGQIRRGIQHMGIAVTHPARHIRRHGDGDGAGPTGIGPGRSQHSGTWIALATGQQQQSAPAVLVCGRRRLGPWRRGAIRCGDTAREGLLVLNQVQRPTGHTKVQPLQLTHHVQGFGLQQAPLVKT